MWQNAHVNTVRRAMMCDVYFPFPKISLLYEKDYPHIHSIFKKPQTNVFIFHLLTYSNIYNL